MTIKGKTNCTERATVCITKPGMGRSSAVPFAGKKKGHKVSTAHKNSQIAEVHRPVGGWIYLGEEMKTIELPELPEIGVEVRNIELLLLSWVFDKKDIVKSLREIMINDIPISPFSSDGCSCWPDSFFKLKGFTVERISLYPGCFWHDVRYWLGKPGDDLARLKADAKLMIYVAEVHSVELAEAMFAGVRAGGIEELELPFSWGFGWK